MMVTISWSYPLAGENNVVYYLIFCLLLLPLWESVIVLCFVVRYFMSTLVLQSLLKQCYRYNKIRKAFSKFYHRHSGLIVKYNIRLKTHLQQGISEPIFMVIKFINSNELLENLILEIKL